MSSKGKSIFHTILLSMLLVLGIEFILLFVTLYLTHVREQLNNNAADILHKQVENRSSYLVNTPKSGSGSACPEYPDKHAHSGIRRQNQPGYAGYKQ